MDGVDRCSRTQPRTLRVQVRGGLRLVLHLRRHRNGRSVSRLRFEWIRNAQPHCRRGCLMLVPLILLAVQLEVRHG